ncbi:MAG: UDP-N-acetylglucosamine--N-acetylmuramyl-(pentapeptide) pyrophosphoryl-undecaprenol N-acetylglucosamine transferase, partial [Oscillospiraceae bacterium]|nr:UDP-N-acetylglucosamine--N-acetylmuramyl-(pentapeptide) pyrophosphoryl-undecaprenol N-acetylglucosamine transferase [Oscillospiraceae bacterium]
MNFLFACGGTAGHINPAVALAQRLGSLMPDSKFLFIGAEGNMELELVPKEGYEIKAVKAGSLHRSLRPDELLKNFRSVYYICVSTRRAKKIIREFKPDAVLGTGGYVCYPVIRAASELGIPTLIHESNAFPGLTTRMLEKYADRVMLGFEESRSFYKHPEKAVFTGTPARSGFEQRGSEEAKKELGIENVPLAVSFWGSLGASHMNEVTAHMIAMNERDGAFRHIHASGGENAPEKMTAILGGAELKYTEIRRYIYDMPLVMAAADVVICRSGASTLCELTAMGKPAVLVPSVNVTNNHQEKNARVLADRGGALLIREEDCTPRRLYDAVVGLCRDPG